MKKVTQPLLVLAAFLALTAVGFAVITKPAAVKVKPAQVASVNADMGQPPLPTEQLYVNDNLLTVEMAVTAEEQKQGLSKRPTLAPDAGMLFPFDLPGRPGFWMPDMNFPLDFVYLMNRRVVEIKENVQPSNTPLPFFPSTDTDSVLEVNAGWVQAHGIKVGDPVGLKL